MYTWSRLLVIAAILATMIAGLRLLLFDEAGVRCDETGPRDDPALRCAFDVAAPPTVVWQAFTVTGEPRPYYFDAVLEARLEHGGRWRFVTDDRARLLADGEVLVVDPPREFAHTFAAADLEDPPSRVSVRIASTVGGSRVLLVHDRFVSKTATYRRFRRAHPLALAGLKSVVETGKLPLRTRLYTTVFKPGMKLFTVRAEPWEGANRATR